MRIKNAAVLLTIAAGLCAGQIEHRDTSQRIFVLPAGERSLNVDNVFGSIRVKGSPGSEVRVSVQERWRAESASKLAEGRKAVRST